MEHHRQKNSRQITHTHLFLRLLPLFILFHVQTAYAVPANPGITKVIQPDGSGVEVAIRGDEWRNWVETRAGYTVARDKKTKQWVYVDHFEEGIPKLTDTPANQKPPPLLKPHQSPGKKVKPLPPGKERKRLFPQKGLTGLPLLTSESGILHLSAQTASFSGYVLFILVQFSDRNGFYTESSWGDFISNDIADFYFKASNKKVSLTPAKESSGTANNGVIGWVNVSYPHIDTRDTIDSRNQQLAKDAIEGADQYIDYASYDMDGDGYVDADELAIVVIAAGYERSYSPSPNYTPNVWGHQWSLWSGSVSPPVVDGVVVGDYHSGAGGYAQFGEIHQSDASDGHQATMGIMVHELGHLIFGFPDLYDTDDSSSGIGAWCVMSSGSWGKSDTGQWAGETPVLPSAWIRHSWGWVSSDTSCGEKNITAAGDVSATRENSVVMARTADSLEYFLIENRYPAGYDCGLERWLGGDFGGLAIWHIDEKQSDNTNDANRLVDLEEADGTPMTLLDYGTPSDLWYLDNASTFNDSSTPDSSLYPGTPSGVAVTRVSPARITMSARLQTGYCRKFPWTMFLPAMLNNNQP